VTIPTASTGLSVLHVLPGSDFGGAEGVVFRLARAERSRGIDSRVVSLKPEGSLGAQFHAGGVPLASLNLEAGPAAIPAVWRWRRKGDGLPFHVAVGWLPAGNLMAGIAAGRRRGLVWNVMQADLGPQLNRFSTRLLIKGEAWLSSRWPHRIVCNSLAAQSAHHRSGFDPSRMVVVPNGVDTELFKNKDGARERLTNRLGVGNGVLLVGILARWDPHKDHRTFIHAADRLVQGGVDAHFLLAGPGVTPANPVLAGWIGETSEPGRFHLLGPVEDAAEFLSSLDVACLSSVAESSPYALVEAMACGIPCVSTDAGDARIVLGEGGTIVPVQDPGAFEMALRVLADLRSDERRQIGAAGRRRAARDFSFAVMSLRYEAIYREAAGRTAEAPPPR